jgi:hypothetical protein
MRGLRVGGGRPSPDDMPEPLIPGNLPLHGNPLVRHATEPGLGDGVKRQPSPEHDGRGPGIPRGDAQREGISGQGLMTGPGRGSPGRQSRGTHGGNSHRSGTPKQHRATRNGRRHRNPP